MDAERNKGKQPSGRIEHSSFPGLGHSNASQILDEARAREAARVNTEATTEVHPTEPETTVYTASQFELHTLGAEIFGGPGVSFISLEMLESIFPTGDAVVTQKSDQTQPKEKSVWWPTRFFRWLGRDEGKRVLPHGAYSLYSDSKTRMLPPDQEPR